MSTAKSVIKSPVTRWVFLGIALAGLLWALIRNWGSFVAALVLMPWWVTPTTVALSLVYVFFTLWSWRVLLTNLGSKLSWSASAQLFGISQIGKYIPGGVWNIVAAARIGRDHKISAHRSVTAITVAMLISVLSGVSLGAVTLLGTSTTIQVPLWLILLVLVALCIVLIPPVLNRLIHFGFKLLKHPEPETQLTYTGLILSFMLYVIALAVAGVQIWILALGMGMRPTFGGLLLSIGAYALAWVIGFLVVFAPAGTGVREGILGLFFAGILSSGGVLAIVLVSRVAITLADLLLAGLGLLLAAHDKNPDRSQTTAATESASSGD